MNVDIENSNIETDVVIVGAGPVGIFASYSCGMLGLSSAVVESREGPGGQCTSLYPDKYIYDVPGYKKIGAKEFVDNLMEQATTFDTKFYYNENVVDIQDYSDGMIVKTGARSMKCKAVIVAAGMGACIPNRLVYKNASIYENKQLFYNIKNIERFRNRKVVVLGGGNSAADWTLELCEVAEQVTIIHRRDVFTAFESTLSKFDQYVRSGKLRIITKGTVMSLEGNDNPDNPKLFGILVKHGADKIEENIDVDDIVACYGLKTDLSIIKNFGIDIDAGKICVKENSGESSRVNVFAVGDIANFALKRKLFSILSGFNECAIVAHEIHSRFGDQTRNISDHSSSMF